MANVHFYEKPGDLDFMKRCTIFSKLGYYDYMDTVQPEFNAYPTDAVECYKYIKGISDIQGGSYCILVFATLESGKRIIIALTKIPIILHIPCDENMAEEDMHYITSILSDYPSVSHSYVYKKIGNEYNNAPSRFIEITCPTKKMRTDIMKAFINTGFTTYTNMQGSYINTFLLLNQSTLSDWIHVSKYKKHAETGYYIVNASDMRPVNLPLGDVTKYTKMPAPKLLSLCYDLEAHSYNGEFPDPDNIKNTLFMIGGGISFYNSTNFLIEFCIIDTDISEKWHDKPISETCQLIICKNEALLLMAFAEIIRLVKPEFMEAFNNFGFDDMYIFRRCSLFNLYKSFLTTAASVNLNHIAFSLNDIDRESDNNPFYVKRRVKLESSQDKETHEIYIPGIVNIDIYLILLRTNMKDEILESHALKAYLDKYNLPNKKDMPIPVMNKAYVDKNIDLLVDVADYCVTDALSCQRLQLKVDIINYGLALSTLSFSTYRDCLARATGFKVKNNIYFKGNQMGYVYDTLQKSSSKGKYPGAEVLNPIKGIHKKAPIFVPDFASLYPSIMRALNMSSETIIKDKQLIIDLKHKGYGLFEYSTTSAGETYDIAFIRTNPDGTVYTSVYCSCLEYYATVRKQYKKLMAEAEDNGDELSIKAYNNKQLAVKVLMNTFYGLLGDSTFHLYEVAIAASITQMGRTCLLKAKEVVESMGHTVVYGDTDSLFIEPKIDIDNSAGDKTELILQTVRDLAQNTIPIINEHIKKLTGTGYIVMEFDKLLYPLVMLGKKMYYGTAWDTVTLKKKSKIYFSGIVSVKRGNTQFLKNTVDKVIKDSLDITTSHTLIEVVENAVVSMVRNINRESHELFVQYARYSVGKESFVCTFMEECKRQYEIISKNNIIPPDMKLAYTPPLPSELFSYIVAVPQDKYLSSGKINQGLKTKTSRMMLYDVYKLSLDEKYSQYTERLTLDYEYYVLNVIPALARFIHSYMDPVPKDNKELTDKDYQNAAERHLIAISKGERPANIPSHKVRAHRNKIIKLFRTKGCGALVDIFCKLYDRNKYNNIAMEIITILSEEAAHNTIPDCSEEDAANKILIHEKNILICDEVLEMAYNNFKLSLREIGANIEIPEPLIYISSWIAETQKLYGYNYE